LEQTVHHGPSVLDLATLRASSSLPLSFLEGTGVPAGILATLRPLASQR
jgi:hypothetical protein